MRVMDAKGTLPKLHTDQEEGTPDSSQESFLRLPSQAQPPWQQPHHKHRRLRLQLKSDTASPRVKQGSLALPARIRACPPRGLNDDAQGA